MGDILLLLPKAESMLMYYRRGVIEKNHVQTEISLSIVSFWSVHDHLHLEHLIQKINGLFIISADFGSSLS